MLEICAELSANHLGSLDRALDIVDAAAEAGADLFKLQTWSPDTMCIDRGYTVESGPWAGRKLFDLYREAWTPWDWHEVIFDYVRAKGMIPFSAAFDRESVDFLERLGVDRHKVASFELVDLPLIRYMATKGKPILLSTGMASQNEISAAMYAAEDLGVPVECVSSYPARPGDYALRPRHGEEWGLSDHSIGVGVSAAAAALGAGYIEKHLTMKRGYGLDGEFSMEPGEFKVMVDACRQAEAASKKPAMTQRPGPLTALRRSLWAAKDIAVGDRLVLGANIVTARPALGAPPVLMYPARDRLAQVAVAAGQPIPAEMFD